MPDLPIVGEDEDSYGRTPYAPIVKPIPIPPTNVFDAPLVCLQINEQWVANLLGVMDALDQPDAWQGTEIEIDAARQNVRELMNAFSSGVCANVVTDIRIVDCVLEKLIDGVWLPIEEFEPECFIGPPGPEGPPGSAATATIVRTDPAGFGNMEQNISGAGYTDITNSDFLRRDGAYPMVGGLEITNAQTTEPALTITMPAGSVQSNYKIYSPDGFLRQELLSTGRFFHYGSTGNIRFDGAGNDIAYTRDGANWLSASANTDNSTSLRLRVGGVDTMAIYTQGRTSIGLPGFRNVALHIQALNSAHYPLIVRPATSSTLDIISATDSAGVTMARVKIDGSLEAGNNDAGTNTVPDGLSIYHQTTATPTAGFGVGLRWQGKSSTTSKRDLALLRAVWETTTDASRKAQIVLSAFDTSEREVLRGGASGSAPKIGFLGATPVIRQPISGDAQGNQLLYDMVAAMSSYGLLDVTGVTLGVNCCEELEGCVLYDFRVAQYNSEWSLTDGNWQDGVGIGPDAITGYIRMNLTIAPDDMHMTYLEITGTNSAGLFGFDLFVYSDNNASIWFYTHSTSTPWLRSSTFPTPEIVGNLNIEISSDTDSPVVIERIQIRYLELEGNPPGGAECE